MPFRIHYNHEKGCFIGRITGHWDVNKLMRYLQALIRASSKNSSSLYLHDLRKAEIDIPAFEIYNLPKAITTILPDNRKWRGAIVVSKNTEQYRFFETVAVNHGYNVKIFLDFDEAMNWLAG